MTDKDKEAFEKWYFEVPYKVDYHASLNQLKEAWQAALEYERARSEELLIQAKTNLLFEKNKLAIAVEALELCRGKTSDELVEELADEALAKINHQLTDTK